MERNIVVQRANVILHVSPEEKKLYLDKGYSVIDEATGKVIEASMPTDVPTLQKMVQDLRAQVTAKDEEIEKLKAPKPRAKAKE